MPEEGKENMPQNPERKGGPEVKQEIAWPEIYELIKPDEQGRKAIENPWLTRVVEVLAKTPEDLVTPEFLQNWYNKGAEKFVDEEIPEEEWALLGGVIGEKTERIKEDFPKEPDKQRKFLIERVEQIEATDLPIAPVPGLYTLGENQRIVAQEINPHLEKVDEELRREIITRLKLQHCSALASAISGRHEDAVAYLYSVFVQPESKRYALEGEDFDFLFNKEEIHGLKITKAFNLLQEASLVGVEVEKSGRKKRLRLTQGDLSLHDRHRIRQELIEKLKKDTEDEHTAHKSLQLAERIATATLETSVWNKEVLGNDPLAEAIYFKTYRTNRARVARDRGPDITLSRIEGFGTSFLRSVRTTEKVKIEDNGRIKEKNAYLFLPEAEHHLYKVARIQDQEQRVSQVLRRNRGERPGFDRKNPEKDKVEFLRPEQMEFNNISSGEYVGWLGIAVPRILQFKQLLLQTTFRPEDFGSDRVESWVAPSNAADPEQALRLRCEFILGAFWSIFSRGNEAVTLGWDVTALQAAEKNLLRKFGGEGIEESNSFLSERQLRWVKKSLKDGWGLNLYHKAALVRVWREATKRYGG